MALDVSRSGTRGRRPSNRGVSYSYVRNGLEITAKWPRSRGRSLKANTREQMEYFRQVQDAFKLMDPKLAIAIRNAVAGTPLMPRDLFLKAISGRLAYFIEPNGRRIFSVAGMKSVSDNLDILGQVTGDLLFRGLELWERLEIGAEGQVLTVGPDLIPVWAAGGGGGGASWRPLGDGYASPGLWDGAVEAPTNEVIFTDLTDYQDFRIVMDGVTKSASAGAQAQFSVDNGATWFTASGDYKNIAATGAPSNSISVGFHNTATTAARWSFGSFPFFGMAGVPKMSRVDQVSITVLFAASLLPVNAVKITPTAAANFNGGRWWLLAQ